MLLRTNKRARAFVASANEWISPFAINESYMGNLVITERRKRHLVKRGCKCKHRRIRSAACRTKEKRKKQRQRERTNIKRKGQKKRKQTRKKRHKKQKDRQGGRVRPFEIRDCNDAC